METLYQAQGTLQKNFIGQISYTVCLDKTYETLDIGFTFDKQRYSPDDLTEGLEQEWADDCLARYAIKLEPGPKLKEDILHHAKTEIHVMAMLNNQFIGCVHKQLTERHLVFSPGWATKGCLPQPSIQGVLTVTLLVFNVILDHTHYELLVNAC